MKISVTRPALTLAVLCFAGLALAACGADPGQMTGGGAAPSAVGGGILDLVNKMLPAILTAVGVPAGLAGGIPAVLSLLRGMKAGNSKAEVGVENEAIQGLLSLLPVAAQAVKARVDGDPGDGVAVLKGLLGQRIQSLDISEDTLRKLVQGAVAAVKPPTA